MSTPTNFVSNSILFVDLDNTLLATDVLWESILDVIKREPLTLFQFPLWISKGKVYFKHQIANRAKIDTSLLPVNQSVLDYITEEKSNKRTIILATASLRTIAEPIAERFGVFDGVIATDEGENMGGRAKLTAMKSIAGDKAMAYIGDRAVDIPIWQSCKDALVVNPTPSLRKKAGVVFEKEFYGKQATLKVYLKQLRVYQWVKNILVFAPLMLAHKSDELSLVLYAIISFFSFSLCASGVYVMNDLFDVQSDRVHTRKRNRPLASGALSIQKGVILIPLLFISSGILASLLSLKFVALLGIYGVLTTLYSVKFKQIPMVDVIMLAILYTLRILAGSAATDVPVSSWLLTFSMFFFLSMAFIKRYTELLTLQDKNELSVKGRGYETGDIDIVRALGPVSGFLAVLVFALYINSPDVMKLYTRPQWLWLAEPLLLYWISRVWFLAHRKSMHDDPIVFALKDKESYVIIVGISIILFLATIIN